jgi:hypothetical protein
MMRGASSGGLPLSVSSSATTSPTLLLLVSAKATTVANADAPGSRQHLDVWSFQNGGDGSYFGRMPPQIVEAHGGRRTDLVLWHAVAIQRFAAGRYERATPPSSSVAIPQHIVCA